jgi:carbamoylphosphate synthase large subunit
MAPERLIAAAAVADRFVQTPPVADSKFEPLLLEVIADAQIDTYVPTFDPEIVLGAELREAGRIDGVACTAPPSWSAALCWDKLELARWMDERGLPTPKTLPAAELHSVGDGWIAKPRRGVGSVGVARVTSENELDALLAGQDLADAIVQSLLPGPELTVDAFLAAGGRGAAVCRERIEVKSGVCTKARIFHDEPVESLVLELGRALEIRGAFCVQVMQDASGSWRITDVNPRPGAGTRLSVAVGFNVHAAMFADLWDADPWPYLRAVDGERWAVRQYREIILV